MYHRALRVAIPMLMVTLLQLAGCQTESSWQVGIGNYYDIGGFQRTVATQSPDTQIWFDRGLTMSYGFNHGEAIRCFERAIAADPDCAMAHWGLAYASGPNINYMEMDEAACERAWTAVQRAAELSSLSPTEHDLINALAARYAWPAPADRSGLDLAYANAMRGVFERHQNDPDVAALFAESLMILRPWNHWSKDGRPAPETPEIVATLERGLALAPDHPALCHFYIHTMEASPTPEKALPAANRLRSRVPGSGHLVHMPSHIDVLVGNYDDAVKANQRAIKADRAFLEREGAENFYTFYRIHNYHFVVYGAMFDGRRKLAYEASRELVDHIPPGMLAQMPDFLDAFVPTPIHVMVRFGMWDDLLAEPEPPADLPMTRATWHYGRGVALAALGRVDEAEFERADFETARALVPETSRLFNNASLDILSVAEAMLDGEIAYRKGEYDTAFTYLEEAVRRDDALNYDEPWGWMQPARHALGALLLEQGHVAEAESVYEADLDRHPKNMWALHGLAECLRRSGRVDEAVAFERQYEKARARADVAVRASCYCRVGTPSAEATATASPES